MEQLDKSIYASLIKIQKALKAPKSESGRFGKHRNVESILEALKPHLASEGCAVTLDNDIVFTGGKNYAKATATLWNDEGASIAVTSLAWEGDVSRGLDAPQVSGSASSYARKYALGGLFAIDDSKDPDSHKDPSDAQPTRFATASQKFELSKKMKSQGLEGEAQTMFVQSVLNKDRVNTYQDYEKVMNALEDTEDEQ